jgi:hypothetical protein
VNNPLRILNAGKPLAGERELTPQSLVASKPSVAERLASRPKDVFKCYRFWRIIDRSVLVVIAIVPLRASFLGSDGS